MKTISVIKGPITTSTATRINNRSFPPSAVNKGGGYHTLSRTNKATAAMATLINRCVAEACQRVNPLDEAIVVSAILHSTYPMLQEKTINTKAR